MSECAPMIVNAKKAVVFDLFHTLVSLEEAWGDSLPRIHDILGVSREAWRAQLEKNLSDLYCGGKKDAFGALADMARAIDPTIPDHVIRVAAESIIETFAGALTRVPAETTEVLTLLRARGKRIGLVSNASTMEVAAWDRSPIAPFFDSAVFSCDVGYIKPDRRIYETCMKALGVAPGESVFIGDGGSKELEGAHDLGMATIMIAGLIRGMWPGMIEERRRHADVVIERLSELLWELGVRRYDRTIDRTPSLVDYIPPVRHHRIISRFLQHGLDLRDAAKIVHFELTVQALSLVLSRVPPDACHRACRHLGDAYPYDSVPELSALPRGEIDACPGKEEPSRSDDLHHVDIRNGKIAPVVACHGSQARKRKDIFDPRVFSFQKAHVAEQPRNFDAPLGESQEGAHPYVPDPRGGHPLGRVEAIVVVSLRPREMESSLYRSRSYVSWNMVTPSTPAQYSSLYSSVSSA